jgi:hypothetical protein
MMILLEGKRLIQEALAANVTPLLILFSRRKLLEGLALDPAYIQPEATIIHRLNYRHMKTWSSVTTCPGIIGKNALKILPRLLYNGLGRCE